MPKKDHDIRTVIAEVPMYLRYDAREATKTYWVIDTREEYVMYGYQQRSAADRQAAYWNDMGLKIGPPRYIVIGNPLVRR